ncbi:ankyrin repeat-containing domain protein [Aspergillus karnatakaensis]|uniref:ankyrin repeat-containing domain protein n=1 Tax=Aspergillus karnatakaensis TaxID=1810916 RepID=UPI003CCD098B
MIHLFSLPNELLHQIAESVESQKDLNALVRTSRPLHTLLTPILYRLNAEDDDSSALFWAAEHGHKSTAQLCLEHGADTKALNRMGVPPLFVAAEHKQLAALELLLAQPDAVNDTLADDEGNLLCWACKRNLDLSWLVELLLARDDVDVNIQRKGYTALIIAVVNTRVKIVELLLGKEEIDVQIGHDTNIGSAVEQAKRLAYRAVTCPDVLDSFLKDRIKILEMLLDREDVQFELGVDEVLLEVFSHAVAEGPASIVEVLLTKGLRDVGGLKDNPGPKVLSCAAFNNQAAVVEVLIRLGIDVNCHVDRWGSPLLLAVRKGCGSVVGVLLAHGAAVDVQDDQGMTPLSLAVDFAKEDILQQLLQAGANIWIPDSAGRPALWYAVCANAKNAIRICLNFDSTHRATKGSEISGLLVPAARLGHLAIMKLLMEFGADLKVQDSPAQIPLCAAAITGQVEVVKFLLDEGVDVNTRDSHGLTALHHAVDARETGVARMLMADPRIDVNVRDDQKRTALHLATEKATSTRLYPNHQAILLELLAHPATIVEAGDTVLQDLLVHSLQERSIKLFRLLLERWRNRIDITENVVKMAVAVNDGKNFVDALLDFEDLRITDQVHLAITEKE